MSWDVCACARVHVRVVCVQRASVHCTPAGAASQHYTHMYEMVLVASLLMPTNAGYIVSGPPPLAPLHLTDEDTSQVLLSPHHLINC